MKIGLVCPYGINKHGGVQELVLALRQGLSSRGHEVKIITPKPRDYGAGPTPDNVIFFGSSTDFRVLDTTPQVSSTADSERVDAILAAEQFDILHFHEPWVPLLSRQLLQRSNAVNVGTFHAKIPDAVAGRALMISVSPYLRSVLKYLDVLTAVSHSGAEYVSGMTRHPINIIPNGIELKKYDHHIVQPSSDGHKTILFVGRLERRKGLKYLLKAFKILSHNSPGVRLLIAGDGPDRNKLEQLAKELKLHNVKFLGRVSEELKLKLLHEADLFCSPAIFGESFGIVLLEAMASNTVTVAGNNSGYVDLMEGPGALSIVNPDDIEEFARRLKLLLEEDSLRKLWQSWARSYVKQFDYPKVVEQYEQLYIDALKQHAEELITS